MAHFSYPGTIPKGDRAATGAQGELIAAASMEWLGYKHVRVLPRGSDGGADVVASSANDPTTGGVAIAESKAWESSVGEGTFRKFTGATSERSGLWKAYADKDRLYFARAYADNRNPNGQSLLTTAEDAGVALFQFVEGAGVTKVVPFNRHAEALVARKISERDAPVRKRQREELALHPDFTRWTVDDVQSWLRDKALGEFAEDFDGFDGRMLMALHPEFELLEQMRNDKRNKHTPPKFMLMRNNISRQVEITNKWKADKVAKRKAAAAAEREAERRAQEEAERTAAAAAAARAEKQRAAAAAREAIERARDEAARREQAEAERIAAPLRAQAEAERIAAQQRAQAEAERVAAQLRAQAEAERIAAERRAQAERLAREEAERIAAQRRPEVLRHIQRFERDSSFGELVAIMREHHNGLEISAGILEQACMALRRVGGRQSGISADNQAPEVAGAIAAVVAAMRAYPAHAGLQLQGLAALDNLVITAASADVFEVVVAAMHMHTALFRLRRNTHVRRSCTSQTLMAGIMLPIRRRRAVLAPSGLW